jgi:hypothetical protein
MGRVLAAVNLEFRFIFQILMRIGNFSVVLRMSMPPEHGLSRVYVVID